MQNALRINKYLADKKICSRREADKLIEKGVVYINNKKANLGDKVSPQDTVEIKNESKIKKRLAYFAFNKPKGIVTHSARGDEKEIKDLINVKDIYPIGRLDKDSHGLIILTNDGRVTGSLLDTDKNNEKEYVVRVRQNLRPSFREHMEKEMDLGDFVTKKCKVNVLGEKTFKITLTEGKKHQIRRMCAKMHLDVEDLKRTRILNIKLGIQKEGSLREIKGAELNKFLTALKLG